MSHCSNISQKYVLLCIRILICLMTQHHRGRPPSREMWVFGMVDTSHQPALGYMRIVQDRRAATLLPIIQQHVAQGTIIYSDEWRSYSQVAALSPVQSHLTVNYSITFVDRTTGAHTQHIESYWNRTKLKLQCMKGCNSDHIAGYLDEFMWRERFGKMSNDAWNNILVDIAHQYPV